MPVFCSHCSEELFGAVNRCWKCGRHFTARPAGGDTPPVRRAPVAGPVMLVREERGVVILDDVGRPVVSAPVEALVILDDAPLDAQIVAEPSPAEPLVATIAEPPPRTTPAAPSPADPPTPGSPFAAGWIDSGPALANRSPDPEAAPASEDFISNTASSTSMALGIVALIAALFHWWPLALGFAGLAAGIWGLRSRQPGLATAGLGVSCAAIAASEFQAAMSLYQHVTGIHPFGP